MGYEIQLEIEIKAYNPKKTSKLIYEYIGNRYDNGFRTTLKLHVLNIHQLMATRTQIRLKIIIWLITVLKTHFGYLGIKLTPKSYQNHFTLQAQVVCMIKCKNGTARSINLLYQIADAIGVTFCT